MSDIVEFVSKKLCIYDGNDPDLRCSRHKLPNFGGIVWNSLILPEEDHIIPAWTLYAHIAEALINDPDILVNYSTISDDSPSVASYK